MVKFFSFGAIKKASTIGHCTADVVLKNGNIVEYDLVTKKAKFPTVGTKAGLAIVMNEIDKPELATPNAFAVEIGENPRLVTLKSIDGKCIEMDMDQVDGEYASIAKGAFLVANTSGKLEVAESVDTYAEYFVVVDKTTYNGAGLVLEVHA